MMVAFVDTSISANQDDQVVLRVFLNHDFSSKNDQPEDQHVVFEVELTNPPWINAIPLSNYQHVSRAAFIMNVKVRTTCTPARAFEMVIIYSFLFEHERRKRRH